MWTCCGGCLWPALAPTLHLIHFMLAGQPVQAEHALAYQQRCLVAHVVLICTARPGRIVFDRFDE